MSKEHKVTYSAIDTSLLFAEASNSFLTNIRECLLIEGVYISSVLKWKVLVRSFRRVCHFEPVKIMILYVNECVSYMCNTTCFFKFQEIYLSLIKGLRWAMVLTFDIRDLCLYFANSTKQSIKYNIQIFIILYKFYFFSLRTGLLLRSLNKIPVFYFIRLNCFLFI